MKEIRDILDRAGELAEGGRSMVLATVVHLEGSSYRRPGARMLVSDSGGITGAISGGCLEGDALEKALVTMTQQHARIVTYDTMDDDDPFGVGLGCNGVLQVLMEPVRSQDPMNPVRLLDLATRKRRPAVLATLFSLQSRRRPQPGTCLLLDGEGNWHGSVEDAALEHAVKADMMDGMKSERSRFLRYTYGSGTMEAFVEHIPPAISLVIVGAGNDALPLAAMAKKLGWETTVVDGRSTHASPERFGGGCRLMVSKPEEALERLDIDGRTAFVLITHNYGYDKAMMKALLGSEPGYLGMLGPRRKCERMLEELRNEGVTIGRETLERLHAPVGLDIGAEGPEEIALSIAAGIRAAMSGRTGAPLRDLQGAIHTQESTRVVERKLA